MFFNSILTDFQSICVWHFCVYFCFSSQLADNMGGGINDRPFIVLSVKYNDPLFTWPDFILFVVTQFTRNVDITSDVVDSFHTWSIYNKQLYGYYKLLIDTPRSIFNRILLLFQWIFSNIFFIHTFIQLVEHTLKRLFYVLRNNFEWKIKREWSALRILKS